MAKNLRVGKVRVFKGATFALEKKKGVLSCTAYTVKP